MGDSGEGAQVDLDVVIKKLRRSLSDVLKAEPEYDEDWFFFPFLKNHQFDVEKAAANIRESIKWRKEMNFKKLRDKEFNEGIYEQLPMHLDGRTIDGTPVGSMSAGGDVDHVGIIEEYGRERYLRHFLQFFGKAEKLGLEAVKARGQDKMSVDSKVGVVMIGDVKDYSLRQAKSLSLIQTWVESCQLYRKYIPGVASTIYIVNMNKIFAPILKMMMPWFEGPCVKINLFDEGDLSWKEDVLEQILASQIRPAFGGTKQD